MGEMFAGALVATLIALSAVVATTSGGGMPCVATSDPDAIAREVFAPGRQAPICGLENRAPQPPSARESVRTGGKVGP